MTHVSLFGLCEHKRGTCICFLYLLLQEKEGKTTFNLPLLPIFVKAFKLSERTHNLVLTHIRRHTLRRTKKFTLSVQYTCNQFHLALVMLVRMMAHLLLCEEPIVFIDVALGLW